MKFSGRKKTNNKLHALDKIDSRTLKIFARWNTHELINYKFAVNQQNSVGWTEQSCRNDSWFPFSGLIQADNSVIVQFLRPLNGSTTICILLYMFYAIQNLDHVTPIKISAHQVCCKNVWTELNKF